MTTQEVFIDERVNRSLVVFGYTRTFLGESIPTLEEIDREVDEMLSLGWQCEGIHNTDSMGAIYAWFRRDA